MKLKEVKSNDTNFDKVIEMLVNHFNYSIKEIDSFNELTPEEKSFINRDLFNKVTISTSENSFNSIELDEDDVYTPITWPDIQYFMELDGFNENSYLINDDKGLDDFGSSAYMVNVKWIKSHKINK